MTTTQYGWFGVLAGAYRGGQLERRAVAHASLADEGGNNAWAARALCGYKAERLCDIPAEDDEDRCPRCAEKLARRLAKGSK